jgi:hypothetical protein
MHELHSISSFEEIQFEKKKNNQAGRAKNLTIVRDSE